MKVCKGVCAVSLSHQSSSWSPLALLTDASLPVEIRCADVPVRVDLHVDYELVLAGIKKGTGRHL